MPTLCRHGSTAIAFKGISVSAFPFDKSIRPSFQLSDLTQAFDFAWWPFEEA